MDLSIFSIIGNIIGILGFIISIINFIYYFLIRRKKLNIRFETMATRKYFDSKNVAIVKCIFENQSQLPISITRIQLIINNELYDCENLPVIAEKITRKQNNEVYDEDIIKTNSTPINLMALSAFSGYFAFAIPKDTLSNSDKSLTFQICTNRGKAVQKTFVLNEDVLLH